MKTIETAIPEVRMIEPAVFEDGRGFFMETWRRDRYAAVGLPGPWVQDNLSFSRRGVIRGLHYQWPGSQGKLLQAVAGKIYDVAVDIRVGSATFGRWVGVTLSGENRRQLWVPPGFAHGFCVVSGSAWVQYRCTSVYTPAAEHTIRWNDPTLAVDWPVAEPLVSAKDAAGLSLSELPRSALPVVAADDRRRGC